MHSCQRLCSGPASARAYADPMSEESSPGQELPTHRSSYLPSLVAFAIAWLLGAAGLVLSFVGFEDSSYPYDGWGALLVASSALVLILSGGLFLRATRTFSSGGGGGSRPNLTSPGVPASAQATVSE